MAVKIYIGTEQCDYEGDITCTFSAGDIRDISEGGQQSSYDFELPLTDTNKRLLKFSSEMNVFDEVTEEGTVTFDDVEVLRGKVIVISPNKNYSSASILIQGSQWYDHFKDARLRDLDLTTYDHDYTQANIEGSWTGIAEFYRYPMINFGGLFSAETGATANWGANDFIPMFRIVDILTRIFYPFTLGGAWLTVAAEKYILGTEPLNTTDFLKNKDLDVQVESNAHNAVSEVIPSGGSATVTFAESKLDLNTTITDEGGNWNDLNDWYVIPATGTYQFVFAARPTWSSFVGITIDSQTLRLKIVKDVAGVTTDLQSQTWNYSASDILNGITYTINSRYVHLNAGDRVYVTGYIVNALSNSGIDRTITNYFALTTTKLTITMTELCRYTGIGKNIQAEEWMPDVSQMDFVRAVKQAYGLKFTPDMLNKAIYVESSDTAMGTTEKTLTLVDFSNIDTENIAQNYKSDLRLKLKTDTEDKAVAEYLKYATEPYLKDIALTSVYAEKGRDDLENSLFAWTVSGLIIQIAQYTVNVLRIFGAEDIPIGQGYPDYRASGFTPRLLTWVGLTSGFTWYLESVSKTTYPKATTEDMSTVYSTNLIKTFHVIDKGKIVKLNTAINLTFLQQFMTVVNAVGSEGFRVLYSFVVGTEAYSGYINKIEFNSSRMLIELILKI